MDEYLYDLTNQLKDKNINFTIVPNTGNELEQKWEEAFTKDISQSQKRKMTFKQCMWNVFSWEKILCLKEQKAIAAFDLQKKEGCYLICTPGEESIYIPKATRLKAKDIIHVDNDLYIVDEHFTWTYVLTHEEDCGPYFYNPQDSPVL